MTISEAGINALSFVGTNYAPSKNGRSDAEAERKRNNLAEKNFKEQ